MTQHLISTCVGGRRAGVTQIIVSPQEQQAAEVARPPTKRELEVLEAVIDTGYCTLAAVRLGMSVKTIEVHMMRLREKFDALSNYQLVARYVTDKTRRESLL